MIHTLIELAKELGICIPNGSEFISGEYVYKAFGNNEIKSLWNGQKPTSFVIGIIVNGKELKYPFELKDFKKELKDD